MKTYSLNIGGKILLVNGVIILLLVGSLIYVYFELGKATKVIEEQSKALTRLDSVIMVSNSFFDMRYWITDLALSWQNESEEKALAAKEKVEKNFSTLETTDGTLVQTLRPKLELFASSLMESVDAYVDENRVLGNSLVAEGRNSAGEIEKELSKLFLETKNRVNEAGKEVITSNIEIRNLSLILIAAATIIGVILSLLFSRSLTAPLRGLMTSMEGIASGNLRQAKLEVKTSDEIGVLSSTYNTMLDTMQQMGSQARDIAAGVLNNKYELKGDLAEAFNKMVEQLQEKQKADEKLEYEAQQAEVLKDKVDSMLEVVNAAAEGDLTHEIMVNGSDAIGKMGEGLSKFLADLRKSIEAIGKNANSLAHSSKNLSSVSQTLGANAEETSTQANVVAGASDDVSKNVELVATGAEEMNASIKEIAKNANDAARVAAEAVRVAESTNQTVSKLGTSSAEIGEVIKVINSIAEQTNLLALNATIEAARAGEAGKGFAVVANEVKDLAKETSRATEEISNKIQAIQTDTSAAVSAIEEITKIINKINDTSNTIASAVEEQTATTSEIGRNVTEAARGTGEIAQNIAGVAEAAQSTTTGANDTQKAAADLSNMAAELQGLVSMFKC